SNRPNTKADRALPDDVPHEIKRRRHAELMQLQHRMSMIHHRALVGSELEVLIEGYSKAARKARQDQPAGREGPRWRNVDQLTGRTRGDAIVVFPGPADLIGQL